MQIAEVVTHTNQMLKLENGGKVTIVTQNM